ncbi:unnamed protein product [Rhodiola kirilowii]
MSTRTKSAATNSSVKKGPPVTATRVRVLQNDLKMAKDQLALALKEKAEVVDELKEARKIAGEANEKLSEVVAGQKRAEEASKMEKIRVTETARKKEGLWNKEMENLRAQHTSDADAFLSAAQEVMFWSFSDKVLRILNIKIHIIKIQ